MYAQYRKLVLTPNGASLQSLFEVAVSAFSDLVAAVTPKKKQQQQPVEAVEVRHQHRAAPLCLINILLL